MVDFLIHYSITCYALMVVYALTHWNWKLELWDVFCLLIYFLFAPISLPISAVAFEAIMRD